METQKWAIKALKQNPDQKEIYGELGDAEFESLVADIEKNGLRHPIETTDDGTIIDGHQRVRAYVELGFVEIEVVVRKGLDANEVKERLIRANLNRRQLDPIEKARAIKALAEIECARQGKLLNTEKDLEFREHLARQLGGQMSGRTVDRHLQLLRLPRPIQDAVSSRDLPMTKAIRVESLHKSDQLEITARIAKGEHPKLVLNEYFPQAMPAGKSNQEENAELEALDEEAVAEPTTRELYRSLIEFCEDNLDELEANKDALVGEAIYPPGAAKTLHRAIGFFEQMRDLEIEATERLEKDLPANVGFGRPF